MRYSLLLILLVCISYGAIAQQQHRDTVRTARVLIFSDVGHRDTITYSIDGVPYGDLPICSEDCDSLPQQGWITLPVRANYYIIDIYKKHGPTGGQPVQLRYGLAFLVDSPRRQCFNVYGDW